MHVDLITMNGEFTIPGLIGAGFIICLFALALVALAKGWFKE